MAFIYNLLFTKSVPAHATVLNLALTGVNKPGKLRYFWTSHVIRSALPYIFGLNWYVPLYLHNYAFWTGYHFQPEAFLKKCGDLHVLCRQFTRLYPNFPWVPSPPYPSMLLTNFEYNSGCNGPDRITRRTGIQPTITWSGLTKFPCFSCM